MSKRAPIEAGNEACPDATSADGSEESQRALIESHPLWYHTLEIAPGLETPGWFDLRPVVDSMPWPDVEGKRCLDIGTYDGFLAFEMERRGAREVVAVDISNPEQWDWGIMQRERGVKAVHSAAGSKPGAGFAIAKRLLGSTVERVETSVYELSPDKLGSFDCVTCGSLLLHLRDPVRALEAIRSVCDEQFMSSETIRLGLTLRHRRNPVAEFRAGKNCQWWILNAAGHRRLVESAGFTIERTIRPYAIPFGNGHKNPTRPRNRREQLLSRLITGRMGVPHSALLARPAAGLDGA